MPWGGAHPERVAEVEHARWSDRAGGRHPIFACEARLRPNSTLAVIYDLKVFFTVIDFDPLDVRRRHVLEFIRVLRTGSADKTVIPIDQSEGLALSTIRRRLSTLAGFDASVRAR